MVRSHHIIATPPGATIREQIQDRGFSQKEFAARMNLSEKHISKLINGEVQLTPDVAVRLEMVLGTPARFWNNLEAIYREKLIKAQAENEMDADLAIAEKIPYNELASIDWIPKAHKQSEQVVYLRKYFEVVQLGLLQHSLITRIACCRLTETESSYYALLAWAQRARLEARSIETKAIRLQDLSALLPELRSLITQNPAGVCPYLVQKLADCGVALVFLPQLEAAFWHGATFQDGNKIVMGLVRPETDIHRFWFSLFHELAHILYGHINQANGTSKEDEAAADSFARDMLSRSASL